METIADRIQWILTERGMSARALSEAAGRSPTHVSLIVDRFRKDPDAEVQLNTLRDIARAGGVSLQWLIHGTGSPEPGEEAPAEDARPQYGNLLGWTAAEAQFKTANPGFPGWAYADARATRAYAPPGPVTPAFVGQVVMHAYNIVPVEERARRALVGMNTQAKRINTRAEKKAARSTRPANDAPAYKLEPPKPRKGARK